MQHQEESETFFEERRDMDCYRRNLGDHLLDGGSMKIPFDPGCRDEDDSLWPLCLGMVLIAAAFVAGAWIVDKVFWSNY